MDCRFMWYNLPNRIKEIIAPYNDQLSDEAKKVTWYNLPSKLNKIYEELSDIKTCTGIEPAKFIWYNLPNKLKALCELVECEEEPTYNFDLTSPKWASNGITGEASFINWLANKSLTNIVVTDFNFVGDRIFCNMTADGTIYSLAALGLVNADKIGVVNGLTILDLGANQIVEFNPTIALPSSLTNLYLYSNQIVEFNPTIALPSSLTTLFLGANQIVEFNPTIALPSSLTELYLYGNQIVTFNPTIPLPSSLTYLDLNFNQMTLAGYTASEAWANAQPAFTNPCTVYFIGNIDSITGTNLEAILITKNCVIQA